jgi:hypothetical protein
MNTIERISARIQDILTTSHWSAVLAVLMLAAIGATTLILIKGDGDIDAYYRAANDVVHGRDPYNMPGPDHRYFLYLPIAAILFVPFTLIPRTPGIVVFTAISVICLCFLLRMFYRLVADLRKDEPIDKAGRMAIILTLLVTFDFVLSTIRQGQVNIIILALAVWGVWFSARKREAIGGAIVAFSVALKPLAAPLLFIYVLNRRFRKLSGLLLGGLLAILIPAFFIGFWKNFDLVAFWIKDIVLNSDFRNHRVELHTNLSLQAAVFRLFGDNVAFYSSDGTYFINFIALPQQTLVMIGQVILALSFLILPSYLIVFRNATALVRNWGAIALALSLTPLTTPVAQKQHLVFLIPAYLYLFFLWIKVGISDKLFRTLVLISIILGTLTAKFFLGEFANRLMYAAGTLPLSGALVAAAVFRAGYCCRNAPTRHDTQNIRSNEL